MIYLALCIPPYVCHYHLKKRLCYLHLFKKKTFKYQQSHKNTYRKCERVSNYGSMHVLLFVLFNNCVKNLLNSHMFALLYLIWYNSGTSCSCQQRNPTVLAISKTMVRNNDISQRNVTELRMCDYLKSWSNVLS